MDPEQVAAVVNGKHEKPYAGPTGTLKGRVRIDGDPPPDTDLKFPPKCRAATRPTASSSAWGSRGRSRTCSSR